MGSFAFGSFLDCEKGHFACFIFKPFPLSALPLVSIRFGKYSTDWVQCDGAFDEFNNCSTWYVKGKHHRWSHSKHFEKEIARSNICTLLSGAKAYINIYPSNGYALLHHVNVKDGVYYSNTKVFL